MLVKPKMNLNKLKIHSILWSLVLFCNLVIKAQENVAEKKKSKYSIELNTSFGITLFTSLKDLDKTLNRHLYPSLISKMDAIENTSGGVSITLRRNRWGLIFDSSFTNISSSPDENKHYYSGETESFNIGVLYDVLKTKYIILSPYITLGSNTSEINLDYKFEQGVTPTSLLIKSRETAFNFGFKSYFRVGAWSEEKWQLFLNLNTYYNQSLTGSWRLNNMKVESKDFNLSNVGILGGIVLLYEF